MEENHHQHSEDHLTNENGTSYIAEEESNGQHSPTRRFSRSHLMKLSIVAYLVISFVSLYCMLLLVRCKRQLVSLRLPNAQIETPSPNGILPNSNHFPYQTHDTENESENSGSNIQLPNNTNLDESLSFEDVGQVLFGWWGRFSVDLCLLSSQLGFVVVYQIFLGDNIHALFPQVPKLVCMFIPVPILMMIVQIRRLRWLAATSFIALFVFSIGFTITLTFTIMRPEFGKLKLNMGPSSWSDFATMISFAVFSYEGIGLVLPVENSVRNDIKPIFSKLFSATVLAVTIVYTVVGALGFVGWGDDVGSSLLLNLISLHGKQSAWVKAVVVGFIIGGFCSYPLNLYPVMARLEQVLNLADVDGHNISTTKHVIWKRTGVRCGLVLVSLILALAIPSFGLLIGLLGSLFCTALAFVFPTLFNMKLFSWPAHWKTGPLKMESHPLKVISSASPFLQYLNVGIDIAVCLFGIIATIVCTIVSIDNIIVAAKNGNIGWAFQPIPAPSPSPI